uniref:Uncharacterized protein n=1 Tax=Arundo donax TaxID=35708 RepID=A0A0A9G712_ARUDO
MTSAQPPAKIRSLGQFPSNSLQLEGWSVSWHPVSRFQRIAYSTCFGANSGHHQAKQLPEVGRTPPSNGGSGGPGGVLSVFLALHSPPHRSLALLLLCLY